MQRLSQHKTSASWFTQIKKQEFEYFDTRQEALDAETRAIQNEKPLYNIRKKSKPIKFKQEKYNIVADAYQETKNWFNQFSNTINGRLALRVEEACELLGVDKIELYNLMDTGSLPYSLVGKRLRIIPARSLNAFLYVRSLSNHE